MKLNVSALLLLASLTLAGCDDKEAATSNAAAPVDNAPVDEAPIDEALRDAAGAPADATIWEEMNWNGSTVYFVDYSKTTPDPRPPAGDRISETSRILIGVERMADHSLRRFDITRAEEEGGTPEIKAIATANADGDDAQELTVLLGWPQMHYDFQGTYYEVRIFDDLEHADADGLTYLEPVSAHFNKDACDCDYRDGRKERYAFKTTGAIKAELEKLTAGGVADAVIPEPAFTAIREPADDELRETGLVTGVEDNGYPLFTVTIEFHAGQPGFPLSANAEALNLGVTLDSLTGKTVTVYYVSGEAPDLMDMRAGGRSLMEPGEVPDIDPEWKSVTGRLSGADAVIGGDLPDTITVESADGGKVAFDLYITDEMVAANGKTVTAIYGMRPYNRITLLAP
ncbi:MAG: hypothetical protein CVT73_11515 [Alphaproteobacteria bacterium HGW-Alphaproteobacteria-12]|nr:MAG: hypothetical protein CVT73_11515 [Alphaproteobacteria bacterium HGW-Alphaproteobacteria-12]